MASDPSYKIRNTASPHNHKVYDEYLSGLGSPTAEDLAELLRRGITNEHIIAAKYASKGRNGSHKAQSALAQVIGAKLSLEKVAGFYKNNDGHWSQSGIAGIVLPTRDIDGNIHSLTVRNDNPKMKNGRPQNKYVAFSSAGKTDGSRVFQKTHCPIITGLACDVAQVNIRLTEGILKADISTALGDKYCIGLHGLKVHDDLEDVLVGLEASILFAALDSGEDENPDMIKIKSDLIIIAERVGCEIRFEEWDPKYGKGIDDVLAAGHADKIKYADESKVKEIIEAANSATPNKTEWFYCVTASRFIHVETHMLLKKDQFSDKYRMPLSGVGDIIEGGFPMVDKFTFAPAGPLIIKGEHVTELNLWLDPKIEPIEGDISIFLDHLKYLFPHSSNENKLSMEAELILDWMAFQCQNPGIKINWAMLIKGNEGVGKSAFESIMGRLLGRENVREVTNEELHEPYTAYMKNSSLIVIHEMMSRGRLDTMNKVKPLITQDTVNIREMYQAIYSQKNVANFLMFSNYDDSIIIDKHDRRYCVIWSYAILMKKKQATEYYSRLWDWIRSEGMAGNLLSFLKERDISEFDAKGSAPMTNSKKSAIKASQQPLEEWVEECVEDRAWPFAGDIVSIRHLKDTRVCPKGFEKLNNNKWAKALQLAGGEQSASPISLSDGSQARLWVMRRHGIHLNTDGLNDHLKRQYEKYSLDLEPGGNPLEDIKPI